MFDYIIVVGASIFYIGFLFLVASWAERKSPGAKRLLKSPMVYSLSLSVLFTSWTFFGSVGFVASKGLLVFTNYLGSTLAIFLWWIILRKLVRIKNMQRISSIADFISARYDRSKSLGALVTLVILIGIMPYIALQLKSVSQTFSIITSSGSDNSLWFVKNLSLVISAIMVVFTIVFGVRKLDPTERHEGIVILLVVEAIVKLVAFLVVGIFVTYFLFDGFSDIFQRLEVSEYQNLLNVNAKVAQPYITWITFLMLSMTAFMFFPRQFHVAVVENSDEKHIKTSMWVFPLYKFFLTIFVVPITAGGLLFGLPIENADSFVLSLPLQFGKPWLTLLVFIGGFSAATGMMIVSSMTLSTMISNYLFLPIIGWVKKLSFLRKYLLQVRWGSVILVMALGYFFEKNVGDSFLLVNMGIMSFAAALQFAPLILGGIFWRRGNKKGALLGLSCGFLIWFYTLFIPSFVRSGWLSLDLLEYGPWGIGFLKPENLFGLTALNNLSHSVFWSMLFNVGFYVAGSLIFQQSEEEQSIAEEYVGALGQRKISHPRVQHGEAYVDLAEKKREIKSLLIQFFSQDRAEDVLQKCLQIVGVSGREKITIVELAELHREIETILAGSVGAAIAHDVVEKEIRLSKRESGELSEMYARILSNLRIPIYDLRNRIDYYQEREILLTSHARELENKIKERDELIAERLRIEKEMRNLRNYLRNIIDSMPSMLIGVDSEGRITQWNEEAARITHVESGKAIGQMLVSVLPRLIPRMDDIFRAMRNKKIFSAAKQVYFEGGEIYYEDLTIFPLITNGVEGVVIRIDDVTEQVRIEEMIVQSEKMLSVGGLAAGMAHEINNPLAGMIQTANVLLNRLGSGKKIPANQKVANELGIRMEDIQAFMERRGILRMLTAMQESGERVTDIVQNMLSFSRKSEARISNHFMDELLEKTIELAATDYDLKRQYDFRKITIIREYEENLPGIPCEAAKIQQVLLNILRNGAEAMQEAKIKEPHFVLRTMHEKEQKFVRIEIEDNGPGMDESIRKRVFEPFFTTKPPGIGTGLGLSVSYFIIVENHHGEIFVESHPDEGTKFVIRLPQERILTHEEI